MYVPCIDVAATGMNIKRLCSERGLSVREVQDYLNLSSSQAIYKWFRGESVPKSDNLIILAELFDVQVDDILVIRTPERGDDL